MQVVSKSDTGSCTLLPSCKAADLRKRAAAHLKFSWSTLVAPHQELRV